MAKLQRLLHSHNTDNKNVTLDTTKSIVHCCEQSVPVFALSDLVLDAQLAAVPSA